MQPLRLLAALTIAACLVSVNPQRSRATVDASSAWNSVCSTYEFPSTAAVGLHTTFGEAWAQMPTHSLSFGPAFTAILNAVSSTCGSPSPMPVGDDEMAAKLANWPS